MSDVLTGLERDFVTSLQLAGIRLRSADVRRFVACLLSKRFLIITGLSGSGKTRSAQAFARWITPEGLAGDPFKPGFKLKSAQNNIYTVVGANEGVVELESEDGTLTPLLRSIIEEWAKYIQDNHLPETIGGKDLRVQIEERSKINRYLHRLESHYKPAAFALVEARKTKRAIKCYDVIPVGADWTSNESVLGYPNGLDKETYITKPALDLMLQALEHPQIPHFLILDEMNLSHVERYFADILSAIESDEKIVLHGDEIRKAGARSIPGQLTLPGNLFVIGTVNVDETTYMFSPKVLDRANVVEFRVEADELKDFLDGPIAVDLAKLDGRGTDFAKDFVIRTQQQAPVPKEVKQEFEQEIMLSFNALKRNGAEFGYRVVQEAARYVNFHRLLGGYDDGDPSWFRFAFDCVVVQKLLPKLHGSRARLGPVLKTLWFLCMNDPAGRGSDALKGSDDAARSTDRNAEPSAAPEFLENAYYRLSAEKVGRMWHLLNENGFASFAEA